MPLVATITTPDGDVVNLDKFLTADGRVLDELVTVEEELTAAGVTGRRYRDVSQRYPEFEAQVLQTFATYPNAVTGCRIYDRMIGKNVRLTLADLGGAAYTYIRVHVVAARAAAVPGAVAGSVAGASHAAHIVCPMTMAVMEVTSGANP